MKITSSMTRMAGGFVLMLALVPVGMCQTMSAVESEPASSETFEEIIVYGEKSLIHLRHKFYRAEESFFAMFNELNSDDMFDVDCDYVTFLGDRRKHHLCMPKFAKKAEADATAELLMDRRVAFFTGDRSWAEYSPNRARVRKMDELMWKEVRALLVEHPELQEAITELARAKESMNPSVKDGERTSFSLPGMTDI
jgi:hypothetical protein